MLLAGEVVHGRTDNGPKDGVHSFSVNYGHPLIHSQVSKTDLA